MMRAFIVVMLGAVAQIAAAQAPAPYLPSDPDANAQLVQLVEATRANGLPIDPIVAKVQYGVRVRHADPARIVASARAIAARLEIARDALAPASATDIAAGANALGSGATREALRAVRSVSRDQPVATSLAVLAQLLESNVPLKKATEIVTSFIRRGATSDQLVAFGENVNADVTNGAAALAALDTRARFLSGVLAPAGANTAAGLTSTSAPSIPKKP